MFRVREQISCPDISYENQNDLNIIKDMSLKTHKKASTSKITVAVLDTGMAKHPDLADKLIEFRDFTEHKDLPYDDNGHGTHVCGILCGSGKTSNGRYRGIAPNINLVVGKVLDKNGDGQSDTMLQAIDWIKENHDIYHIRIVNISVGVGKLLQEDKEKLLRKKLEELWKEGIIVVCAAGNNGPSLNSLSYVGKSPYCITVGCHDGEYYKYKKESCAFYSARGDKFSGIKKPDIVAPGTNIISCNALCIKAKKGYRNAYISKSGTSMATPIISGALALLLEKNPSYDNETAKRKLLYTATDLYEPWYQQGWGMVNIKRLLE